MVNQILRRILAAAAAVNILSGTVTLPVMNVSAEQLPDQTGFDYKMLPGEPCKSSPARQYAMAEDGSVFTPVRVLKAAELTFYYANSDEYGDNTVDGDENWFDDMSIENVTYRLNNLLYGDVDLNCTIDLSDFISLSDYQLGDMILSE